MSKAARKWTRYFDYCARASSDPDCKACIEPLAQDKRFAGEAWQKWPFNAVYQGFPLTQQWWHNATTDVGGVSKHHDDVVSFVARQLLDVVSPANFPLTNLEVLDAPAQATLSAPPIEAIPCGSSRDGCSATIW